MQSENAKEHGPTEQPADAHPSDATASGSRTDAGEAPNLESRLSEALSTFRRAGFDFDEKRIGEYTTNPLQLIEELAGWIKKQRSSDDAPGLYKRRVREGRVKLDEPKKGPPGTLETKAALPSEVSGYDNLLPKGR